MTHTPARISAVIQPWARRFSLLVLIATLFWIPFPLGSAVSWGAGLAEILLAGCWLIWLFANGADPAIFSVDPKVLRVAAVLYFSAALWAIVQIVPVPTALANPVWSMAADLVGGIPRRFISINPWRTEAEILKLVAEAGVCWLTYSMAKDRTFAATLFNSVIVIAAFYAVYAFGLAVANVAQAQLIYGVPFANSYFSGPFMLHNSFATYCGMGALAAMSRLVSAGAGVLVADRGARRFALSLAHYLIGQGGGWLFATIILFAATAASASRGGFSAMMAGFLAMAFIAVFLARKRSGRVWGAVGLLLAVCPMLFFVFVGGSALSARLSMLLDAGTADNIRLALWEAARHMIASAPWQGLGLGTFQDAYPLYANTIFPFVMDKAHSDYLELAAGLGLPAAIALWTAIAILTVYCLFGVFSRRRDRVYALTSVCATVLVATHSSVDFSLQMPAVAFMYAVLLGIGVAQSRRTKES